MKSLSKEKKLIILKATIILIYLISLYSLVMIVKYPASSGFATLSGQETIISASPSSQSVNVGDKLIVAVYGTDYNNLYGYQFDFNYNQGVLKFSGINYGSALGSIEGMEQLCAGQNELQIVPNRIGYISCTRTLADGVSGSSKLAELSFDAIAAGASGLAISNILLLTPGQEVIPALSQNSSVTVASTEPSCTLSPASATVEGNSTLAFAASCSNTGASCPPISWSQNLANGSSISQSGLFSAGTSAGNGNATASGAYNGAQFSCSAAVAVTAIILPAPSCTLSPASATIKPKAKITLIPSCANTGGSCPTIGWSETVSGGGSIDTRGTFTAGNGKGSGKASASGTYSGRAFSCYSPIIVAR